MGYQHKHLHQPITASGRALTVTGKTMQMVSPLTGQLTTYYETYHIQISEPAQTTPDLVALRDRINTDILAQGIDANCDDILYIGSLFTDQYKPRVWVAETTVGLDARTHELVIPIAILLVVIAIIAVAIAAVVIVFMVTRSAGVLVETILNPPKYTTADPDTGETKTFNNWSEYYTYQMTKYWLVCPKCGAGFAPKSKYTDPTLIPQTLRDMYNEHIKVCAGVPKGIAIQGYITLAIVAVGAVAGLYFLMKIVGGIKMPSGRRAEPEPEREEPPPRARTRRGRAPAVTGWW